MLDALLAHDRFGQKRVARAAPQLVHCFLVKRLDLQHLGERHIGDFFQRRETLLDQNVGDFLVDVELLHEQRADFFALGLMFLLRFLDAHQVDFPTSQLGSEPDVLPAAADRHGQVLLVDHDVHRVLLFVDDDARYLSRRQRVDDELCRVVGIKDDVDALSGQLVGHRGHARAAHADAGALRVEPWVVGFHRDLGAHAGIARRGADLDQTLLELRPPRLRFDLGHVSPHAVAHAQVLLRNQLVARNHALDAPRLDDHAAALDALDRACEQVVLAFEKVIQDLFALGIADLLQDHLLRGLRADAAEFHRLERLLDHVTELQHRIALGSVGDRDLMRGLLVLLVGHDGPAPERLVVAGLAIDRDARVDIVGILLLGRRRERGLERLEYDLLGHVLLARQRVDEKQQFAVHRAFLHSIFGINLALSMLASGIARVPSVVSSRTTPVSASMPRSTPLMRRELPIGSRNFNCASRPSKRAKSASFFSGRSNPGDETSSRP